MSNLIKELLDAKSNKKINEAASLHDVDLFHKTMAELEKKLDSFSVVLKKGSQFRALVEKMGGDVSYVNDAESALKRMQEALEDLNMYTGIAAQRGDE